MKKYADWKKESIYEFLQAGDVVDEEFVQYFINVMPPACMTSGVIQIGEPYSHINGKATYPTLKNSPEGWRFAGNCHRGETVPQN